MHLFISKFMMALKPQVKTWLLIFYWIEKYVCILLNLNLVFIYFAVWVQKKHFKIKMFWNGNWLLPLISFAGISYISKRKNHHGRDIRKISRNYAKNTLNTKMTSATPSQTSKSLWRRMARGIVSKNEYI